MRAVLALAGLASLGCSIVHAQDTQTIITQTNVTVDNPTSNWIAQQAAGSLSGIRGGNTSTIRQFGNNNVGTTDQTGYGNSANLTQTGNSNMAALTQNSDQGSINATQTGNGIGITITQTGHAPAITITQTRPGR